LSEDKKSDLKQLSTNNLKICYEKQTKSWLSYLLILIHL